MKNIALLSVLLFQSFLSLSCSNDDSSNQTEIEGTWQLISFDDSEDGNVLAPNDGKPIRITFKGDGSFDGKAGNNEIQGEYDLENGKLIFTLASTEIASTDWESMFIRSINKSLNEGEYILNYILGEDELTLEYETQSTMLFMKI